MIKRKYKAKDVQALKSRYSQTITSINTAQKHVSTAYSDLINAVEKAITEKYNSSLHNVSIEAIMGNENDRAVSELHKYGIDDLYALLSTDGIRVCQIHGFSQVYVDELYHKADSIAEEINRKLRITVDPEHLTAYTFDIMMASVNYRHAKNLEQIANRMSNSLPPSINQEFKKMQPLTNAVKWGLTDKQHKLSALESFQRLSQGIERFENTGSSNLFSQVHFISKETALDDFRTRFPEYFDLLSLLFPNRFTVSNSTSLANGQRFHSRNVRYASTISLLPDKIASAYEDITESVKNVLNEEHDRTLESIPVEKLKDKNTRINVSAFRKIGLKNVLAVLHADVHEICRYSGITTIMAYEANWKAREISEAVRKRMRIQLSTDNITPAYTKLVTSISKYRNLIEAEKQKNSKAIHARVEVNTSSPNNAWNDFSLHSIDFYNILEEICPELFSSAQDGYGLDEGIRERVEATEIILDGLNCRLRGYQEWGVKYILSQQKVLLGDEMGLGKTIQALATMVSLWNHGCKHFLVICPASVIENWCREIENKSDLIAYNLHDNRKKVVSKWAQNGGVAVINYEMIHNLINVLGSMRIDMVTVDEAHYIKNHETKRRANVLEICRKTNRILFMTGTPIENNVEEMIGLMECLQPDVAKHAKEYAFAELSEEFKLRITPVYYRRKRDDVLSELPKLTEIKEWCQMTSEDQEAYENAVLSGNLMQARRVSWNNDLINSSSKAKRLRELVDEAKSENRKIIVFSFFLDTLARIETIYKESCIGIICGSVPVKERQRILDSFEKAPPGSVLAAQIEAGGVGLNIQSSSVVIICEPQWKPSTENQAISRAYRMGQTRDVIVYRLLCTDSIDEWITKLLEKKQQEFDSFADESIAAQRDLLQDNTQKEIDSKTQKQIFSMEKERILTKRNIQSKDS